MMVRPGPCHHDDYGQKEKEKEMAESRKRGREGVRPRVVCCLGSFRRTDRMVDPTHLLAYDAHSLTD